MSAASPIRPRLIFAPLLVFSAGVLPAPAFAHDIPNARVDRSTQVTVEAGRLRVDYEVSLSELTLTQELRSLIGSLPGADRMQWFSAYGRETGPLDARGFLIEVDKAAVVLRVDGFDLDVEEHPRFTFHFSAAIPSSGSLSVRDTNYRSSEGTSRLAARGSGVVLRGDDLPADVSMIPERPVWQLTDEEERRTHEILVSYQSTRDAARPGPPPDHSTAPGAAGSTRLSDLFERASSLPLAVLCLIAVALGAVHAIQPGHGKTLLAATAFGDGGSRSRGAVLGIVTTVTHTSSVIVVAALLWYTESLNFPSWHLALARVSGFVIASVGFWRLGRLLGGFSAHPADRGQPGVNRPGTLIGLGVAGGIIPCWDAVGLIVLSAAVHRLGLGLLLVAAFSLGMGLVLVTIGFAASSVRGTTNSSGGKPWVGRGLSLASGLALSAMGVYLLGV